MFIKKTKLVSNQQPQEFPQNTEPFLPNLSIHNVWLNIKFFDISASDWANVPD